jgi:predicted MFS family arabinose efflux permease
MRAIASSAAARRLFVTSVIARLPLAMLSVGLMVHIQRQTGSFAAAGVVTAAYGIALGVGGPVLGRLVDRRGQTVVLLATTWVGTALLAAIVVLPPRVSLVVPIVLAAGVGLATPPVGPCLRAQIPSLLTDPGAVGAAYAFETSVVELTWICGPPLVLGLGVLWSSAAALAAAALVLLIFTMAFAAQPSSRKWKPAPVTERRTGGSLRAPAMRTLTLALLGVGVLLGADEIAVIAAARALHGTSASAAPLLALWGVGSFVGGLLVTRFRRARGTGVGLTLWLAALAAGHLALVPAAGSVGALAIVLPLAGATIAPTESAVYEMVDAAAPIGTITEAFSWLFTAIEIGAALGAAAGGALVDRFGPAAAFGLGAGACALAALLTAFHAPRLAVRRRTPRGGGAAECRPAS